jgi:hypothetical protein
MGYNEKHMEKNNIGWPNSSFFGASIALLLVGGFLSYMLYTKIDEKNRQSLVKNAAMMSRTIDKESLFALKGVAGEQDTDAYKVVKGSLQEGLRIDNDIRFTYLMTKNDRDELVFMADSEEVGADLESLPGDVYYEATKAMKGVFETGKGLAEGPDRDRWGVWVSSYYPVKDVDGKVIAILGVDIPANNYIFDIIVYSLFPMLVAFLIIAMLFIIHLNTPRVEY